MCEVKRYAGDVAFGWPDGEFVQHSDYARLERERDELAAKLDECQCDRLGPETVECAQIVGEALAGSASLHIGHLPDMCRDLVAELTRLRAVEAAALKLISGKGRFHTEQNYNALAEACGRKG